MKIGREETRAFERYSRRKLTDWLVCGLVMWARDRRSDAFSPHSFLNLYTHPIEGIEAVYSAANPTVKRHLRYAISQLAAPCHAGCTEFTSLDDEERMLLLNVFLRLVEHSMCFDACGSIVELACEGADNWKDKSLDVEIFPACLRCIGNLAIKHDQGVSWNRTHIEPMEAALLRLVADYRRFKPEFSPFALAALISIAPEDLPMYLALLGGQIAELNWAHPEQRQLAYLTAERVVAKAPLSLIRCFPDLDFRNKFSRDRWLLEALFAPKGPLQMSRTRDPNKPIISLKGKPNNTLLLPHEDWIHFKPQSVIPLPDPDADHSNASKLEEFKECMQNFFYDGSENVQRSAVQPY